MMDQFQYLTEKEVSAMTRRALSTLRNDRFKRRGIPYHKVGKSVRYKFTDVIRFMESGRIETSFFTGNLQAVKGGMKLQSKTAEG
jgi:hypothetical protein